MELQTNKQLEFAEALDWGTVRRIWQLTLIKKFIGPEKYEEYKRL